MINDSDGLIELQNRDAEIQIAIGAHSADFKKELLERKSLLFENKTIQEIVEAIAKT